MAVTPEQEQEILSLLAQGVNKSDTARQVGVSRRTVIRIAQRTGIDDQLFELAAERVANKTEILVEDLEDYRASQRNFAGEMGSLALRLIKISNTALDELEDKPGDITARNLPGILKAITLLAENSSNAWARATGLEEVLDALDQIAEEGNQEA